MLSPCRKATYKILKKIYSGTSLNEALFTTFDTQPDLSFQDRAWVTDASYGITRWHQALDTCIAPHVAIKKIAPKLLPILRLGTYEIQFMATPTHAAINENVALCKSKTDRGFINAVLRNISRAARPNFHSIDTLSTTLPSWILNRWQKQFSIDHVQRLLEWNVTPPIKSLRINKNRLTNEECIHLLSKEKFEARYSSFSPDGIDIDRLRNLRQSDFHSKGFFSIQSETSQLVTHILEPSENESILDMCAGYGNKTAHILERLSTNANASFKLDAIDIHSQRLSGLIAEINRLRLPNIGIHAIDAHQWKPSYMYNKILVDAPCSGLGTLQSNPDIKFTLSKDAIDRLAKTQLSLLTHAATLLAKNGNIVYSVCTFEPEETTHVISQFLRAHPHFNALHSSFIDKLTGIDSAISRDSNKGYYFYPHLLKDSIANNYFPTSMEGFYCAILEKIGDSNDTF